ncbi:MAG: hypothetical protein WD377_01670 [Nitriliruptoraceae bacterium]
MLVAIAAIAVGVAFVVDADVPPTDAESGGSAPPVDDGGAEEVPDDPAPRDDARRDEAPPRPDVDIEDGDRVEIPDRDQIDADDRAWFDLFVEIDASERVMIGFHEEIETIFATTTDPALLEDAVRLAAEHALDGLAVLRQRFATHPPSDVRDTYVAHLDAWVAYLTAIAAEPARLAGDTTRWTLGINATADTFVHAVDALREDGLDDDLERFVDAVLERGFSGDRDAQI